MSICKCGHERERHAAGAGPCGVCSGANALGTDACLKFRARGSREPASPKPTVRVTSQGTSTTFPSGFRPITVRNATDDEIRAAWDRVVEAVTAFGEFLVHDPKLAVREARAMQKFRERERGVGLDALLPPARTTHDLDLSGAKLGRCPRMLLAAITSRHPKPSNQGQIALISGYRKTSSSFHNALSELRTLGLIVGTEPAIAATAEGLKVSPPGPRIKGERLVAFWVSKLGKCPRTLLEWIVEMRSVDRASLAAATGYSETSSSFHNALSELRVLELITRGEPIRPNEELLG